MRDVLKYVELNANELENVDFSLVCEDSSDTIKWNNNKTKFILKHKESFTPSFLIGKASYHIEEFRLLVNGNNWNETPIEDDIF